MYVPSERPVVEMVVALFAVPIVTEFQLASAAEVILARFVTETEVRTRYAVPVSVLCTETSTEGITDADVILGDGAEVSTDTATDDDVTVCPSTVAAAVMVCVPAASVPVVHDHAPVAVSAVQVLPVLTPPVFNCTVDPPVAVPPKTSAVAEVIESEFDDPVSLPPANTGVDTDVAE